MTRTLPTLLIVAVFVTGCSPAPARFADVSTSVRQSLEQAGLKEVSVSQDRDKGVVTLAGHVATAAELARAEAVAKPLAAGQVIANQIAVLPPGAEHDAKAISEDLDKGIEKNLDAALIHNGLRDDVKDRVSIAVVTLTGDVNSEAKRSQVEKIASDVPNVKQVVNNLEVTNQKATSRR